MTKRIWTRSLAPVAAFLLASPFIALTAADAKPTAPVVRISATSARQGSFQPPTMTAAAVTTHVASLPAAPVSRHSLTQTFLVAQPLGHSQAVVPKVVTGDPMTSGRQTVPFNLVTSGIAEMPRSPLGLLITIGALTFIAFLPTSPVQSTFPYLSMQWLWDGFTVLPIQAFNWVSRPGFTRQLK